MKVTLIEMQPKLVEAKIETEKKIVIVTKEKEIADVLKASISEEEAVVSVAVNEATAIKNDCQKELDEAIPALLSAEQALLVLDPKEINVLKGFSAPPNAVRIIMKACAILVLKPSDVVKTKNDQTLKMEINWWETSKVILNDPGFLNERLRKYDKENIPEKLITDLGNFMKT
jgi:dynein heavy chain